MAATDGFEGQHQGEFSLEQQLAAKEACIAELEEQLAWTQKRVLNLEAQLAMEKKRVQDEYLLAAHSPSRVVYNPLR